MKSKLLSSSVAILSLSLVAAACGDDSNTTGGGGTGGDGASGGTGGTGAAGLQGPGGGPTTGGGGTGGAVTDGNDSFAEAQDLDEGTAGAFFVADEELDPPQTDHDFYKVTLSAGVYSFYAFTKYTGDFGTGSYTPLEDGFDPAYLDPVLKVYDSSMTQIALNDDPFPRNSQESAIHTILEEDGEYFIEITDFCVDGTCDGLENYADYYDNLEEFRYSVAVIPVDGAANGSVPEGAEPNSTLANATLMEYEENPDATEPGFYYLSSVFGDWSDADTIDSFRFTAPANVNLEPGSRPRGQIFIPPAGVDANGSSQKAGVIEIVNATTMEVVSRFDMSGEEDSLTRAEPSFPTAPGQEYLMRIGDGPTVAGSAPFYFFFHNVRSSNPVETAEVTNSVFATAESLMGTLNPDTMTTSSFIEGDLPTMDVDHYLLNVTDDTLSVACGALRDGSGATVRAEILSSTGMSLAPAAVDSNAIMNGGILIQDVDVSAQTTVIVKIDKTAQAANNTGAYYQCGFHFAAPAMP